MTDDNTTLGPDMIDIALFFLAGSALGGISAWVNSRQPSTLVLLAALYAIAVTVCIVVGHATRVEVMAFITPYAIAAIVASLSSAGLAIHGTRLMARFKASLNRPQSA